MALESFDDTEPRRPLPTGFTYTPRHQLDDFELPPDMAADLADQVTEVDCYHRGIELPRFGLFG